ncbi:hypothetical protein C8R42DRAFT_720468 [Lentinula raphanica]|nr:hypothetical protein C8R42DRAFT_720468 [Lentinula raphanica]
MFRLPLRRCLPWRTPALYPARTLKSVSRTNTEHQVDSLGLPIKPLWSVNDLLSSYPQPELSPSTFKSLHELSALIPPEEGSQENVKLKKELEELVKLVEAVKLVDTTGIELVDGRPFLGDGDVEGIHDEDLDLLDAEEEEESGRDLLKHASRTEGDFYVVEADRER